MSAALRAAITAALWQTQGDAYSSAMSPRARTALIDDLCRFAARTYEIGVCDIELARVAAEGVEPIARIARALYAARQLLSAADLEDVRTTDALPGVAVPAEVAIKETGCLRSGLIALAEAGVRSACTTRSVVEALERPKGCDGAVARLLRAGCSDAPEALVAVLGAQPYGIAPADLALALRTAPPLCDVRERCAAAIGSLPGGRSREAAVAALDAVSAASRVAGGVSSLATAAQAVESALREYACSVGEGFSDPGYAGVLEAAKQADLVWNVGDEPAPAALRIASLLDGVARAHTYENVALIPDAGQKADARLKFRGDPSLSLTWHVLAKALGMPDAQEHAHETLCMRVAADEEASVAAYLARRESDHAAPTAGAWPGPEPDLVFTAPPMTFSASRLNAYVKCPRRWFFDYLCQALDDPSSLQAAYGSVIHDALESLHRSVRVPGRHDPGVLLERLLKELDGAFGNAREAFPSQLEYEVSRARARRIAEHYVRWLVAESAREPMAVEHVELMQRLTIGGHDFVGYIDRIDRPLSGGPVTILDYKTGRIETDARAYLDKMRRGDEAQLALYYAMRMAAGDEIKRIALVSVRDPRDEVWIMALDIADGEHPVDASREDGMLRAWCSPDDLKASLESLLARCDMLTRDGQAHFAPGLDPPCGYCAYRTACRERPPDGERIFAR